MTLKHYKRAVSAHADSRLAFFAKEIERFTGDLVVPPKAITIDQRHYEDLKVGVVLEDGVIKIYGRRADGQTHDLSNNEIRYSLDIAIADQLFIYYYFNKHKIPFSLAIDTTGKDEQTVLRLINEFSIRQQRTTPIYKASAYVFRGLATTEELKPEQRFATALFQIHMDRIKETNWETYLGEGIEPTYVMIREAKEGNSEKILENILSLARRAFYKPLDEMRNQLTPEMVQLATSRFAEVAGASLGGLVLLSKYPNIETASDMLKVPPENLPTFICESVKSCEQSITQAIGKLRRDIGIIDPSAIRH